MAADTRMQPTLWRTCRVLANPTRLRILRFLIEHQDQTVSRVARSVNVTLPVASQSLRALEARGLLSVRRVGRYVIYRVNVETGVSPPGDLVSALRQAFRHGADPAEHVFKLVTSFTHPRRIEIYGALGDGPKDASTLRRVTGLSVGALHRHIGKLESRGLVVCDDGVFRLTPRRDVLGRELTRLAAG